MKKLHIHLLIEFRNLGKYGDTIEHLLTAMRPSFRTLTLPELETAIRDLGDKSLVTNFEGIMTGTRWKITALGESALKEEGL